MKIALIKNRILRLKPIVSPTAWQIGKFFYVHFRRILLAVKFRADFAMCSHMTKRKVRDICGKEKLDVVFLPVNLSMWKYDEIFRLMLSHPRFSPRIIFAPQIGLSAFERERSLSEMRERFAAEGFPVTEFDPEQECRENFVARQNPDIIFITQGYGGFLFAPKDFPHALVCYTPYSFTTSSCKSTLNLPILNLAWKLFFSSQAHLDEARKLMRNRARNVFVSGHTNADLFLAEGRVPVDEWKLPPDCSRKRIIYAPHWTVNPQSLLPYATFLENGETILELAQKFSNRTQWVFKPHPWLHRELCRLPGWGKERADAYYEAWRRLPNATVAEGDYIDLFLTSDAMIHDCGSFRAEYFYTKKPVMYLVKEG